MINKLRKTRTLVSNNLINIPGWRTKERLIVIESDDWGSVRMPDKDTYNEFLKRGFKLAASDYNRLDTLESNQDIEMLYEVLTSVRNASGENPVMTANCIVGNPDFDKIRESDFSNYFVEPVAQTLERYKDRNKVTALWMEGNQNNIFHPQFHGREHVNVIRWMSALRKRTHEMMFTFSKQTTFSGEGDYNFMEVLDYNSVEDLVYMNESLVEGLRMFEQQFGYKSESFIPPCYTWDSTVEEILAKNGVRYIQGIITQLVPTGSFGNYKKKYHFLGNRNRFGQIFLVRNAFFEPSITHSTNAVDECLRRVNIAFQWNKPAIIGTHRINYMGELDPSNRSRNLSLFKELLQRIVKQWPDVRFLTSDALGALIEMKRNQ